MFFGRGRVPSPSCLRWSFEGLGLGREERQAVCSAIGMSPRILMLVRLRLSTIRRGGQIERGCVVYEQESLRAQMGGPVRIHSQKRSPVAVYWNPNRPGSSPLSTHVIRIPHVVYPMIQPHTSSIPPIHNDHSQPRTSSTAFQGRGVMVT